MVKATVFEEARDATGRRTEQSLGEISFERLPAIGEMICLLQRDERFLRVTGVVHFGTYLVNPSADEFKHYLFVETTAKGAGLDSLSDAETQ